jgi:hypothetical protein
MINRAGLLVSFVVLVNTSSGALPTVQQIPQWRLGDRPRLVIGTVTGDERYTFNEIRTVFRQRTGHFVIADDNARIRVYNAQGVFVRQIGGTGSGPGEFRDLQFVFPYRGDSIATADRGLDRISVFDSAGKFGRSFINPVRHVRKPGTTPSQGCCQVAGAFADGSFVVELPEDLPNLPGGPRSGLLTLIRLTADATRTDTIGTFASERLTYDANVPNRIRTMHFTGSFRYAVLPNEVMGGNGEEARLTVVRANGQKLPDIRVVLERRRVTREMRQAFEENIREAFRKNPHMFHGGPETYLAGEYPEYLPAFGSVSDDGAGNFWLGLPWVYGQPERSEYVNFTRTGAAQGRIAFPNRTYPVHFGRNDVIVIRLDEMDVQQVRVYALQRIP